ncbi:uncharacterized protein EHS24_004156 [Apiotrichum porosum]|uniref:Uncharacterized protein n=1 Tax=Apiotrichum porosum TaxID=105984 RepID=A0A427Y4F7_9TREE|nr:uncharacterized protein EHS24_004156 [Apiotrichum porosum]RSH85969.1 hypothetical protein EHS24_004156 [Apiotrichum porosum]
MFGSSNRSSTSKTPDPPATSPAWGSWISHFSQKVATWTYISPTAEQQPTSTPLNFDKTLNLEMYPHILDTIIMFSPRETLLGFRGVSQATRVAADKILFTHILLREVQTRNQPPEIFVYFPSDSTRLLPASVNPYHDEQTLHGQLCAYAYRPRMSPRREPLAPEEMQTLLARSFMNCRVVDLDGGTTLVRLVLACTILSGADWSDDLRLADPGEEWMHIVNGVVPFASRRDPWPPQGVAPPFNGWDRGTPGLAVYVVWTTPKNNKYDDLAFSIVKAIAPLTTFQGEPGRALVIFPRLQDDIDAAKHFDQVAALTDKVRKKLFDNVDWANSWADMSQLLERMEFVSVAEYTQRYGHEAAVAELAMEDEGFEL